jgi:hypothetical protein
VLLHRTARRGRRPAFVTMPSAPPALRPQVLSQWKILRGPPADGVGYAGTSLVYKRRDRGSRSFHSDLVDQVVWGRPRSAAAHTVARKVINSVSQRIVDVELAQLFHNCFPNTLDTTVEMFDDKIPDAFVITGDIHAQWLRDSTNQARAGCRSRTMDAHGRCPLTRSCFPT